MKYQNSSLYVQRQMNQMLHQHQSYAQEYVNDVIIFFKILTDHLIHLNTILSLFSQLQISLKEIKSFIDYSLITLLSQKIDDVRLSTSDEKLMTLTKLFFFKNLKNLETYLDLTG